MLRNAVTPELWEAIDTGSPGDVDFYAQYARHSGGPVLVLMAGSGRICLSIARQGIPVIGLAAETAAVDLAKRKAQQVGATKVMFVQGDPTHFASDQKHPLAIIPGLEACGFAATLYDSFDRDALLPGSSRIVVEAERNR